MRHHIETLVQKAADSSHGQEAKAFAEAALAAAEAAHLSIKMGWKPSEPAPASEDKETEQPDAVA